MHRSVYFILLDSILINAGFLVSFWLRYGLPFPQRSFLPYKNSFVFLTLVCLTALSLFGVYRSRLKSSWELFKKVFSGLCLGTLLCVSFVYVFRAKWSAFPTGVFILSFFINLLLIFKVNQFVLKTKKKIRKKVVILGSGEVDDIVSKKANVKRKGLDRIHELLRYSNVDEIVVSEKITNAKDLNLLLYLQQKLKADVLFSPSVYMELLPERINGNSSVESLSTFVGKQSDLDELSIRIFDLVASIGILLILWPAMILISLLIKLTSPGPVLYKQQRVGKDGELFILYKFRTMVKDAEKISGLSPATENDPRITKKVGKWLRRTRLDELPQLLNVIKGEMSLVGPRPENLYRVGNHKALQSLRLAIKPGLTGLAQIKSFYDLKPRHKIKYDYLYIQRRSLLLNLYILTKTISVVLLKKGQ
jgi:lipopolysaccharide/colanic/teichoic acid biosynthesis glycosyltransferase